ncbi:hypothetical protein Pmani_005506 [Petrolisthes manimaculis]|uniref:Uncharacterized protein n=1 Tax=Petrolisthes manimaculis TaxID=1843537 RepID=A0AAE1QBH1_9EUCA|nr:hypothetical protein Pmani_005506 [Petrolisthes manimaculis]
MEDTRTYFLFPDVLCLLTWVVDCYRLPLDNLNLRPVIGVLAQHPPDNRLVDLEDHNFTSYIAALYVKHLESVRARVVPILRVYTRKQSVEGVYTRKQSVEGEYTRKQSVEGEYTRKQSVEGEYTRKQSVGECIQGSRV